MTAGVYKIKCLRFDPEAGAEPYFQEYEVPSCDGLMSVLDCLDYIRKNLDPGLTYFINCTLGFCRRCQVRVNGRVVMACEEIAAHEMTIEPVNRDEALCDLWCEKT